LYVITLSVITLGRSRGRLYGNQPAPRATAIEAGDQTTTPVSVHNTDRRPIGKPTASPAILITLVANSKLQYIFFPLASFSFNENAHFRSLHLETAMR